MTPEEKETIDALQFMAQTKGWNYLMQCVQADINDAVNMLAQEPTPANLFEHGKAAGIRQEAFSIAMFPENRLRQLRERVDPPEPQQPEDSEGNDIPAPELPKEV